MSLQRHKQEWEEMASVDPLWAIASDPSRRYGRWKLDEFLATGEAEIAAVLQTAIGLKGVGLKPIPQANCSLGYPQRWQRALDFGCGVGRNTRAMSSRFEECVGVDISSEMVSRAIRLNADRGNCKFIVNVAPELRQFQSSTFDFVYSSLVLQHLPSRTMARQYIVEFLRIIRPGGLVVFQLPYLIPWRNQLQIRRRLYALLRRLGFNMRFLYKRAGLNPIRMIAIPEQEVRRLVEAHGVLALVEPEGDSGEPILSLRYYATLR
ncbi:MAG: class I SAM-dependent methyltransferase [Chloroflexia bacterium]